MKSLTICQWLATTLVSIGPVLVIVALATAFEYIEQCAEYNNSIVRCFRNRFIPNIVNTCMDGHISVFTIVMVTFAIFDAIELDSSIKWLYICLALFLIFFSTALHGFIFYINRSTRPQDDDLRKSIMVTSIVFAFLSVIISYFSNFMDLKI